MPELERHLRGEHSDVYSIVYLDHESGGLVVVGLTDPNAVARGELAGFLTYPERLRVAKMEHTHEALRAGYYELEPDMADAGLSYGVDERANTLFVTTPSKQQAQTALVSSERIALPPPGSTRSFDSPDLTATTSAGDVVPVRIDVEPNPQPASRVLGGHRIGVCSAGIQVRLGSIFGTFHYTTTAGHCPDSTYAHRRPGQSSSHGNAFELVTEGPRVDGHADIEMHWLGTHRNRGRVWDYTWQNTMKINSVSTVGGNFDMIGDMVCKSGAATGTTCGTIATRLYTAEYEEDGGPRYFDQRIAEGMTVDHGDSGGAVYGFQVLTDDATAVGIVSGCRGDCASDRTIYSHIEWGIEALADQGWPVYVVLN